ncbi:hypothetical protein ACQKM1_24965 [Peribacillus frigoritolerans]|uniref:hypothetical protein n=1 Tax=Peribacillus frigoritolerans TaxID=450367 RepID=UPI003D01F164
MEHKRFTEGKSEDGSVTKLNPLSTDFYLGDPPKKRAGVQVAYYMGEKRTAHVRYFSSKIKELTFMP